MFNQITSNKQGYVHILYINTIILSLSHKLNIFDHQLIFVNEICNRI